MKCETAREIFQDAHWNYSEEKLNDTWLKAFEHIFTCRACRDWIVYDETSLREWFLALLRDAINRNLRAKP